MSNATANRPGESRPFNLYEMHRYSHPKRDEFAMAALGALLHASPALGRGSPSELAARAYQIADAMVKASLTC